MILQPLRISIHLKELLLLFVLLIFLAPNAKAQTYELLQVDYHRNLDSGNDLNFTDFEAEGIVPISVNDKFQILAFPIYQQTKVDNSGYSFQSDRFYDFNVPVILQKPISKDKFAGLILDVGYSSNLKGFSGGNFNYFAGAFIRNKPNERFEFRYGVVYSRLLSGQLVLPAISFIWEPTDRLRINANNPIAPKVMYTISDRIKTGAKLNITGNTFALNNAQGGYVQDQVSEIGSVTDISLTKHLILHLKAGYTINRNIKVFDNSTPGSWFQSFRDNEPVFRRKNSGLFFEVGLGLGFEAENSDR